MYQVMVFVFYLCFPTVPDLAGPLSVLWECCKTIPAFCPMQSQAFYLQDLSLQQVIWSNSWSILSLLTAQSLKETIIDVTSLSFKAFSRSTRGGIIEYFEYAGKHDLKKYNDTK